MSYDVLFSFVNASVLPAWIMLIFAPRWSWTERLVHSMLWPLVKHALLIPCLFFTFMAGPVGLVLYLLLRKATGKGGWSLA